MGRWHAMDLLPLVERAGEQPLLAGGGAVIGLAFGFFAQRSGFCLRAAVIEFARREPGEKLAVWLLAFSAAVVGVQALLLAGAVDVSGTRQLAARGSLSGAIVGGLLFGAGMVLARGCASRLLVLSATGNLRALLSGLIFAVTAQAALGGVLAPLRQAISGWWTVEGGPARDLLSVVHASRWAGLAFGFLWLLAALWYALRSGRARWKWIGGIGAGLAVALGWAFTASVAASSFQVVPVQGITFSGPSAEWLMRVVSAPAPAPGFDFGLLPGVFAGAFLGAALAGQLRLEGFKDGYSMRRYIAGALAMGFGAMLAGGCAVGAGVSGGAIFSLTAWLALGSMWIGAAATDRLLDREPRLAAHRHGP
ncbi:MAG TPA: YeeE/YedE family protein [Ramlibacter sp.]|uniref:YeeE/YedE family protein n=1 Tax=Ramlibacter sp. TaxID=1917967 RepID=UPI002D7EB03D|nr:YeeE/YedE family protein [Ramlibacter sp.]HET8746506.1 YeeE/YedE family protein [Ramlibacter sp.]